MKRSMLILSLGVATFLSVTFAQVQLVAFNGLIGEWVSVLALLAPIAVALSAYVLISPSLASRGAPQTVGGHYNQQRLMAAAVFPIFFVLLICVKACFLDSVVVNPRLNGLKEERALELAVGFPVTLQTVSGSQHVVFIRGRDKRSRVVQWIEQRR